MPATLPTPAHRLRRSPGHLENLAPPGGRGRNLACGLICCGSPVRPTSLRRDPEVGVWRCGERVSRPSALEWCVPKVPSPPRRYRVARARGRWREVGGAPLLGDARSLHWAVGSRRFSELSEKQAFQTHVACSRVAVPRGASLSSGSFKSCRLAKIEQRARTAEATPPNSHFGGSTPLRPSWGGGG